MSITKYSIQCDYRVGGLKPFIYLIHKNLLNITIKANGADVLWSKTKDGDIYKLNADSCVYNQEETKTNKSRFTNTLEVQVSEQYQEPFLYVYLELLSAVNHGWICLCWSSAAL